MWALILGTAVGYILGAVWWSLLILVWEHPTMPDSHRIVLTLALIGGMGGLFLWAWRRWSQGTD